MNMYDEKYFGTYLYVANKALEELDKDKTKESMMKYVFNYGRAFITFYEIDDIEVMKNLFEAFETWKAAACMLTYRELFTIYPVTKNYNCCEYDWEEDYWASKKFVEEKIKNLDDFVDEDLLIELLYSYANDDLFRIYMRYVEIVI